MRTLGKIVLLLGLSTLVEGCNRPSDTTNAETEYENQLRPGKDTIGEPLQKPLGTFALGKATTFATNPLEADGNVDYASELNERLRQGVTVDNNGAVALWQVIGPHPEGATLTGQFFVLLGVQLAESGDYFIPIRQYLKTRGKTNSNEIDEVVNAINQLTHQSWNATLHPEIDDWLNSNDQPLRLLVEATKKTHYYSPIVPPRDEKGSTGLINAKLPAAQISRELASALIARAMRAIHRGESDAAWRDLLACHRLGRMVGRGASLPDNLIGVAIEEKAYQGDLAFIERFQPDMKRVEACLSDLRSLPPWAELADEVSLTARFMMLEHCMLLNRYGLKYLRNGPAGSKDQFGDAALEGIDWDPALENINRVFDKLAAAMRVKKRSERVVQLEVIFNELQEIHDESINGGGLATLLREGKVPAKAKGQAMGNILIATMFPAVNKLQDSNDRRDQNFDNLTIAFALAGYRSQHGSYPESLDALPANYLPKAPEDQFSGTSLIYRPAGQSYLLYSVGLNGIDDGGRSYADKPKGDDLVVRMPRTR